MVDNNIVATLNLLEALRQLEMNESTILLACSSEEYGLVPPHEIPVNEETLLNPVSPYAVTKTAVDKFGFQYYKSHGIKTIRTRAFNHTGPRRPPTYAMSDFARQIARIERGDADDQKIRVGNLSAVRDYSDVRDIVRAYHLAMESCEPGEVYNVCSSRGYSIKNLLDKLIEFSGSNIQVVQEESRIRPVDVPKLIGDCTKVREETGWTPEYGIDDTLHDLLEYWREAFR